MSWETGERGERDRDRFDASCVGKWLTSILFVGVGVGGDQTFFHFAEGKPGREWLIESDGKGTRKRATVHVKIVRGTGVVGTFRATDLGICCLLFYVFSHLLNLFIYSFIHFCIMCDFL
jgi:hypothetical protein